ncbi:hypothetical protein [Burkholderia vietnamiensis]|uniref:hypothetical protein n=1 Tax=Burkholderia vietnamiensis TaxID=60552 RepID=UPI000D785802|nr:hypothetical protein [Burkholderia vietnamiensis]MDN7668048.1 hypothetical protein [Burkholderia vietnamiensis]GBH28645.1 hypothetical protein BvRS1_56940 [Burkholderia vietnamiensis]
MGVIIEFLAVGHNSLAMPLPADIQTAANTVGAMQVAVISINSHKVGDVYGVLSASPLSALVGDANTPERAAIVASVDFNVPLALAAGLKATVPPDEALRDLSDAIEDAVREARWRRSDLLIIAT